MSSDVMRIARDRQDAPPPVLILSHDVIGTRMAGPGIRAWEMARTLAAQQPVLLLTPQPIDFDTASLPNLTCGTLPPDDRAALVGWLAQAAIVVCNGLLLQAHPVLAQFAGALVLDLYDPLLLENLELFRHAPPEQRMQQYAYDHATLTRQLALGDYFLCATERQRDLYIGGLVAQGRVTPAATDSDPQLRGLIDVVGFGLPAQPPARQRPALRGVLPGIGPDDLLLLWTGGLWDWLDPLTLVRAVGQAAAALPTLRLVFLAGQHPGSAQPMQMPAAARALAAELGLLGTHVFFYDAWVPYEERADFLLEADIAVSLHRNHLETRYAAVRSRFLDHLWAGLPSIVSAGDAAADLVRSSNLGYTVAPEDSEATAAAIRQLATDAAQRQHCAANARQAAQQFTWQRTLAPLVAFCREPQVRVQRSAPAAPPGAPAVARERDAMQQDQPPQADQVNQATQATQADQPAQPDTPQAPQPDQQLVQQIEQLWQLGSTPPQGNPLSQLAQRVLLRLLAPLLAQQRDFNATAVKLFYLQQEQAAQTSTYLNAVMTQTVALQRDLHSRLDTIAGFASEVSSRLDTLQRDLHGRLDTLADFDSEINDRLARLVYTVRLLDDAVAAADEASAALAGQLALLAPEHYPDSAPSTPSTPSNPSKRSPS